jgi:hypothetical protein
MPSAEIHETILPKGTVVKVDGFPYELLEDTPVRGHEYDVKVGDSSADVGKDHSALILS